MLFASTRLTLVRELGKEKFRASFFATEKKELEREGWEKWERSEGEGAGEVLSVEEAVLKGVKEDEEREGGRATGERKMIGGGGVRLRIAEGVMERLAGLRGDGDNLIMLVWFFLFFPMGSGRGGAMEGELGRIEWLGGRK